MPRKAGGGINGAISIGKTEKMEKLPLSETTDSKRGSSGRENLDFKRVWETLLREYRLF